ncbi:hypothetical protein [Mesorhizobium temperatum]|uniref:hypothetical protein n=1 Tax=Mesorhizobium temperatum TaxID=241416 RepID=UPI0019817257|nr:hypothetical protein [Mesorhizobium temperatum]
MLVAALESAGYGEAELGKNCRDNRSRAIVQPGKERCNPEPGTQVNKKGNSLK